MMLEAKQIVAITITIILVVVIGLYAAHNNSTVDNADIAVDFIVQLGQPVATAHASYQLHEDTPDVTFTTKDNKHSLQFRLEDAQQSPGQIFDNKLVKYMNVMEFTDVEYEVYSNKIKETIVLNQPGHPKQFKYQFSTEGFEVEKQPDGSFVFYEQLGTRSRYRTPIFTIPAPYMIDAAGRNSGAENVTAKLTPEGILIITPSPEWLSQAQYPVRLDPTIAITILTLHSHPQQGEDWVVDFTTQGVADLYITPYDQATIDDDDFVSLSCDGQERTPQILPGDQLYYSDWECDGIGTVIHYTNTQGNHTLEFNFGGEIAYAYNESWWHSAWGNRVKITFDNSSQSEDLINFPAVVLLDSNRINYADTMDGGQDIRFVDTNNTTQLQHEIEQWNESGTSTVWVKVPQIDGSSSADYIWMYYNRPGSNSTATTTGVWDDNFVAVFHLSEDANNDAGGYSDSTKNSNNGTGSSMAMTPPTGIGGKAAEFDGSADFISVPDESEMLPGTGPFTYEVWFNAPNSNQVADLVCHINSGATELLGSFLANDADVTTAGQRYVGQYFHAYGSQQEVWFPATDVADVNWHYAAVSILSSSGSTYLDSTLLSKTVNLGSPNVNDDTSWGFGGCTVPTYRSEYDGILDEVRFSNTNRSADWLDFTYCNIKDTCNTFGASEAYTGGNISNVKGGLYIKGGVNFK